MNDIAAGLLPHHSLAGQGKQTRRRRRAFIPAGNESYEIGARTGADYRPLFSTPRAAQYFEVVGTEQFGESDVLEHRIGQDWRSILCALGTGALQCRLRRLSARTVYVAHDRARRVAAAGFLSHLVCDRGHRPCDAELAQQPSGLLVQRVSRRHRRYSLHIVRIGSWIRASVARNPGSGSVDCSLGLHGDRSGADIRCARWGETREEANAYRSCERERGHRMKMLAEYLENAINFEKMAADEKDAKLREQFAKQAAAYRKLAEKRAKDYGLEVASRRD
jgi:hypothetical protein